MSSEGINKFITSDLAIAAFLATHGYVLSDCKKLEGGKFYFEFSDGSISGTEEKRKSYTMERY